MHKKVRRLLWRSAILFGRAARRQLVLASPLFLYLAACQPSEVPGESAAGPPIVTANGEMLQGGLAGVGSSIAVFKGIPYAAAPIGEFRWRPPAPISPREGLQPATEYGPACIQDPDHVPDWYRYLAETFGQDPALVPELGPMSEDCLHLNVWTANLGGRQPWPVMVWIHGGANTSGSPTERPYDGANLTQKGVVVVSFNYRLNVLGFLAHPALTAESEHESSGNYALLDQIAALQWIERNIAAFGGDPSRVTIFGESAGATNIAYLMSSPLARGLFHRALLQSGGYAVNEFRTLADLESIGEGLAAALDVNGPGDTLAALRAAEAEDLLLASTETYPDWASVPNVDGWVLEQAPGRVFDAGGQAPVPLLIGFNRDEWTTLGHYSPNATLVGLHQSIRTAYGQLADRVKQIYPASTDDEAASALAAWQTDSEFACPSRFIADRQARTSSAVFFYLFSRSQPAPGGDQLGAYHGAETSYVMDNLALETWIPREEYDQQLADLMSDYWVQFAATGDPNDDDRPVWPRYFADSQEYLEFGDQIQPDSGIRTDPCDLWDERQNQRLGARE